MKHRLPAAALLLASALLLGGCAAGPQPAESAQPEETLTQEQIDAIGRPDLLMLPVGGYFTIDAAEAHQVMEQLQPAVTIPMHYRDCRVGFRMLDTLDAFLDTELPVKRAEERRFVLQQDMPRQILLPVLVQ